MKNLLANATVITGAVQSIIALLVAFGVGLSTDQIAAIMGATGAGIALLAAWVHPRIPVGRRS